MAKPPGGLTAEEFVQKWSRAQLSERKASHEHFLDLCHLLDQPTPAEADATGEDYCFEKRVKVVGSASKGSKGDFGFVDVWKRGCFAWEYKGKGEHKSLLDAYRQLYQYRDDLDNPPLSVVCDIATIEIRSHVPGYPTTLTVVKLEEIPAKLEVLRRVFKNPLSFKPQKTREEMTEALVKTFGDLADKILSRKAAIPETLWQGHGDPVAHFLMKVMFCLFAEDVGLLPANLFTNLVEGCLFEPEEFRPRCEELFQKMNKGGRFGNDKIEYFNGGLFDNAPAIALNTAELPDLHHASKQPWSAVEPSIFGTLFERILDPKKRAQIGAHYTSKADILLVIDPVIMTPLRRKWEAVQKAIAPDLAKVVAENDRKKRDVLSSPVRSTLDDMRRYLAEQRILDPACGSGNFLYVALQRLLDLDDEIVRFAARYDVILNPYPYIRPTQLHGIEINKYAAEMAQVVIWIGYLQWLAEHHIDNPKRPILDKLITIENRDAILDLTKPNLPVPAEWPEADFIVGNPPFLGGGARMREGLGNEYVEKLYCHYDIPGTSDLCCYWFEIACRRIKEHTGTRAGLLATQGIRGKDNRTVLERAKEVGDIFLAWSDREWVLEGAMVHVSIIGFDGGVEESRAIDGIAVADINTDLTSGIDATTAKSLEENASIQHEGDKKGAKFELMITEARRVLSSSNVNGKPSLQICRPWFNGQELERPDGLWIIDFPPGSSLEDAAAYDAAFDLARERVAAKYGNTRKRWWIHERPRPEMRAALDPLPRFLVTVRHKPHRLFVWARHPSLPDSAVVAFARADDHFFGVLNSAVHVLWARRVGTQVREKESGDRYVAACFETFPLPWPPGKEDVKHPAYQRISEAAKILNERREHWLNPPEWIELLAAKIDAADTFEDVPKEARALVRQSAIMAAAAKDPRLKKRTLTNLYNERPTWLKLAHEQLDRAVLAAYAATDPAGDWQQDWAEVWIDTGAGQPLPGDHPLAAMRAEVDQKILANLLALNHARAAAGSRRI